MNSLEPLRPRVASDKDGNVEMTNDVRSASLVGSPSNGKLQTMCSSAYLDGAGLILDANSSLAI